MSLEVCWRGDIHTPDRGSLARFTGADLPDPVRPPPPLEPVRPTVLAIAAQQRALACRARILRALRAQTDWVPSTTIEAEAQVAHWTARRWLRQLYQEGLALRSHVRKRSYVGNSLTLWKAVR